MSYASVFRAGLFEGRVVIVTGGGSGIGRAIAHELSALGARVVLAGRRGDRLEAVRDEIAEDGGQAAAVPCDVRDEAAVEALAAAAIERFGAIDGLVNNAGGQFMAAAETISPKGFRAVVETNLTGTFLVSRAAYRAWMEERGGAIVNVIADMWRGMPMMAHSGAARAGVWNLTQTLALEWARSRVRVNAVAPGQVLSSGLLNYPEPVQAALQGVALETPARRFATESEVSAAVTFLLSPAASYISGATLRVDAASSLYRHPVALAPHEAFDAFAGFHRAAEVPEALR